MTNEKSLFSINFSVSYLKFIDYAVVFIFISITVFSSQEIYPLVLLIKLVKYSGPVPDTSPSIPVIYNDI